MASISGPISQRQISSRESIMAGRASGLDWNDGTTHLVHRNDTKPVFEQYPSETYPHSWKEHDYGTTVQNHLNTDHSLLTGAPPISEGE